MRPWWNKEIILFQPILMNDRAKEPHGSGARDDPSEPDWDSPSNADNA